MLDAALVSGVIDAHATFEVFTRCLPNGFRYGVVGGTGRFLEALADFSFDDETISWLVNERIVSNDLATFSRRTDSKGMSTATPKATSSRHFRQYFGSKVDSAI